MKILLSESQFNLIRNLDKKVNQTYFNNLVENVLLEANKKDILINKLGFNERNANTLQELAGNLSVWIGKKIIDKYEKNFKKYNSYKHLDDSQIKKITLRRINGVDGFEFILDIGNEVPSIMDWYRVALNGNIKPYENLSFDELYNKSVEWHNSLGVGKSKIDYIEKKEIILDFRQDDEGFYWADLEISKCSEEAERMGHCASSKGQLYSLREYKKMPNNHTLNKSHLTASIGSDGKLLQLKGPKNSKPKPEFHKYIIPLLKYKKDGDYLIKSFGHEYDSKNDFKILDLSVDEIKDLYQSRPDLFKEFKERRFVEKLGLKEKSKNNELHEINILPSDINEFIETTDNISDETAEMILDNMVTLDERDVDWTKGLEYLDERNKNIIIEFVKRNSKYEHDPNMSLKDAIEIYDENYLVPRRMRRAIRDAQSKYYNKYLYNILKKTLSEYGEVIELNNKNIKILIDIEKLVGNDNLFDEMYDYCDNSTFDVIRCVFNVALANGIITKPKFTFDSNYHPSVNSDLFNKNLYLELFDLK